MKNNSAVALSITLVLNYGQSVAKKKKYTLFAFVIFVLTAP